MSRPVIIMAAPNGARRNHADHPALPVSIEETVDEAVRCHAAGASMLHAHVRDQQGQHVLDADRYLLLISRLRQAAPQLLVQMTTEAVGMYSSEQQFACARKVQPRFLTMALREMAPDDDTLDLARKFYHWAYGQGIHVQHILYNSAEVDRFWRLYDTGLIPEPAPCLLYVLGRYSKDSESSPDDLLPFLAAAPTRPHTWFVCAFGKQEHDCIMAAVTSGGHGRIGFENNLYDREGNLAASTAVNIGVVCTEIRNGGNQVASPAQALELLRQTG